MKGIDLIQVSMRGRIALVICTLEQAVQYEQFDQAKWQIVIDKLWHSLENTFVEDFLYFYINIDPFYVRESIDYNDYRGIYDGDEPDPYSISQEEFNDLKVIYETDSICTYFLRMIHFFCDMGYTFGVDDNRCAKEIDECIAYIEVRGLSLPPLEKFQMAVRGDFAEWGSNISRAMFFDEPAYNASTSSPTK
jgi:hypothetical protein